MLFVHNTHSLHDMFTLFRSLPMPSGDIKNGRHIPSIVTRPQVAKILPYLRSPEDREAVLQNFVHWNSLSASEQMDITSKGGGCDFFELSLFENGVTICVSIYRNDEDCLFLRIDPDCHIVIREVPL